MLCTEAYFDPRLSISFPKGRNMHSGSPWVTHTVPNHLVLCISSIYHIQYSKQVLFPHLPAYRAPPIRWPLDLEIILILPDGGCTVFIELVQVRPHTIALVPTLGRRLCLLGPTDVATGTHSSQLERQHPDRSAPWALAWASEDILSVENQADSWELAAPFIREKSTLALYKWNGTQQHWWLKLCKKYKHEAHERLQKGGGGFHCFDKKSLHAEGSKRYSQIFNHDLLWNPHWITLRRLRFAFRSHVFKNCWAT